MNGKQAKRLRRMAYGQQTRRQKRKYVVTHRSDRPVPGVLRENGLPVMGEAITVANDPKSPRGVYRALKALFETGEPV